MTGQKSAIDLKECASNWVQYYDQQRHDFIPLGQATQEEIAAVVVSQRPENLVNFPWSPLLRVKELVQL